MNIFALDEVPQVCATYHKNFHVAKYSEQYLVMLENHITARPHIFDKPKNTLKLDVYNHKIDSWLMESPNNVMWFVELIEALLAEYELRFKKTNTLVIRFNAYKDIITGGYMRKGVDYNSLEHTPFEIIMPEMYIVFEDAVDCYRYYYYHARYDKKDPEYTGRKQNSEYKGANGVPEFLSQPKYTSKVNGFEANSKLAKMVAKYKDESIGIQEKEMILSFIKKEAEKLRRPVEQIIYARYVHRQWYFFRWSKAVDDALFTQLVSHLFGDIPIFYGAKSKKVKEYKVWLTQQEEIKLRNLYEFHKAKVQQEYERMVKNLGIAYITKQNLYQRDDLDYDYSNEYDSKGNKIITEEKDKSDTWNSLNLANGMEYHPYHDAIE